MTKLEKIAFELTSFVRETKDKREEQKLRYIIDAIKETASELENIKNQIAQANQPKA